MEDSEASTDGPGQSTNQKYEQLTRDLDLIMNELSATQASQEVAVVPDIRNPVITC